MKHILYPNNNAITKIFQSDGLGRLTDICEVTAVTQANGAVPASCGLDIAGTGFHSANTYDALGNVLSMVDGSTRNFIYDGLSRPTQTTYPESGVTNYVYDTGTAGDLYQRIAPAPNQTGSSTVTATYTHDALHRLTGISYSDGTTPSVSYNYDQSSAWSHTLTNPKGRMTSAALGSGQVTAILGYDSMGRVALHGQCTPLNCGTTNFFANYTYNYIGEPSGGTDYLGITWANTYNAIGQLSEVTTNWLSPTQSGTIVSGITYNALGEPVADTLNDGKSEGWNYNVDGHVTTFSGGCCPGYNFGFSPSALTWTGDLLTSSSDNVNGSWTYTYDDFARLKSASGSQDFVYGYDQYANRWSTMTGTQQYSFNGVNNHITTNGFAYDAAGNMTNDSIHSYTYDAEGRLKAVDGGNTAKYNYDAFGNRTMQFSTTPSVYNEYVVDLSGRAITAIQPGTSNVYTAEVFAGGRHWVTDNGSALFLGTDWLGTTRALTELNGTFAQLYTSLPWGDGLSSGGSSFDTTSQYTGKEYDPESGLYHFPARQYAPVQGRWLTPDPAGLTAMSLDKPQSWNRYAYVLNSPVASIDPTGLDDCDDWGDCGGCDDWSGCGGGPGLDPPPGGPMNTGQSIFSGQDCLSCFPLGASPLQVLQAILSGNLYGALGGPPLTNCLPICDATPADNASDRLTNLLNQLKNCPQGAGMANSLEQMRGSGKLVLTNLGAGDGSTSFTGTISIDGTNGISAHNLGHEYFHTIQMGMLMSEGQAAAGTTGAGPILGWLAWAGARDYNAIASVFNGTAGFGPLDVEAEGFGQWITSQCGVD